MTTTTQEGTKMSAILDLNIYEFRRTTLQLAADAGFEPIADLAASRIYEYKRGEELILDLAAKLGSYANDLVDEITKGLHAHDWIGSVSRDLSAAIAKREWLINDVKSAIYMVKEMVSEELATEIRTAVFG